jgi:hypothetical protein
MSFCDDIADDNGEFEIRTNLDSFPSYKFYLFLFDVLEKERKIVFTFN